MSRRSVVAVGLFAGLAALTLQACSRGAQPDTAADSAGTLTPVLSVRELMDALIDPVADWVFDAAVVDVGAGGISETMPQTDEDWQRVEHGLLILAESSNLLEMPRPMVPAGDDSLDTAPGGPELTPAEIEARITADRDLWNRHAEELREAALASLGPVRAHDSSALFDVGDRIDRACESCHLEFWYPGDKPLVLEDREKTVTYDPPNP